MALEGTDSWDILEMGLGAVTRAIDTNPLALDFIAFPLMLTPLGPVIAAASVAIGALSGANFLNSLTQEYGPGIKAGLVGAFSACTVSGKALAEATTSFGHLMVGAGKELGIALIAIQQSIEAQLTELLTKGANFVKDVFANTFYATTKDLAAKFDASVDTARWIGQEVGAFAGGILQGVESFFVGGFSLFKDASQNKSSLGMTGQLAQAMASVGFAASQVSAAASTIQKSTPNSSGNLRRDFSDDLREQLLSVADHIEKEAHFDVTRWRSWPEIQEGCSRLAPEVLPYFSQIKDFHDELVCTSQMCKTQVNQTFDEAQSLDSRCAESIRQEIEELRQINADIGKISDTLQRSVGVMATLGA
jgi:hypothetical protein